jgi:hypothetical protein
MNSNRTFILFFVIVLKAYSIVTSVAISLDDSIGSSKDSVLLSYGVNWYIDAFINSSGTYNRLYRGRSNPITVKLNSTPIMQYGAFNSNPNTSVYSVIDKNNKLTLYKQNSFTKICTFNYSIDKVSYLNQNIVTAYSSSAKTIYLINLT